MRLDGPGRVRPIAARFAQYPPVCLLEGWRHRSRVLREKIPQSVAAGGSSGHFPMRGFAPSDPAETLLRSCPFVRALEASENDQLSRVYCVRKLIYLYLS